MKSARLAELDATLDIGSAAPEAMPAQEGDEMEGLAQEAELDELPDEKAICPLGNEVNMRRSGSVGRPDFRRRLFLSPPLLLRFLLALLVHFMQPIPYRSFP